MDYQIYRLLSPILMGFLMLSIGVSIQYIKERISKLLLIYQIAVLFNLVFNYLEFLSDANNLILLFSQFQHLFIHVTTLSWFAFALQYTGNENLLRKKLIGIIGFIVLINLIVVFTSGNHHLFYKELVYISKSGYTILHPVYGPFFWVKISLDYIALMAGTVFIIVSYIRGGSYFRNQSLLVIMGFIIPLIVNILFIYRVIPGLDKDYSAVSFAFTGIFIFISIYRFKLLHFTPMPRNVILHFLDNPIVILDNKLQIIDFNSKASKLFNLSDRNLGCLFSTTEIYTYIQLPWEELREGFFTQKVIRVKDREYDVRINKVSVKENSNKGLIISLNDITDKIDLINRLEKMQVTLIKQEKLAILGQLSAGVAHEINNPLSFIKSNLGVLDKYLKEKHIESQYLSDIEDILGDSLEGVSRISEVVTNLLSFSRENRKEKVVPYQINDGVKSSLVITKNKYRYKAKVILDLGDIPCFLTAGNEINQILINLLTNAASAIPEHCNEGVIKIKTFVESSDIVCEICDNGVPIPQGVDIFEPFYTTKTNMDGTGLGLSISRKIIENEFDGRLFVKDSDEKIFRIEIPVK